jgi:ubiquinone biosynthesis protein
MAEAARKKLARASVKARQQEIRQCLADGGLGRAPFRIWRGPQSEGPAPTHLHRLCDVLEKLGPVFTFFGIYLASRVDLLPARYCIELTSLSPQVKATPIATVRELIARELACPTEEAYSVFEEEPFDIGLMCQSHRAWLPEGQPVTVRVAHPDVEDQLSADLRSLGVLREAFVGDAWASLSLEGAAEDFRQTLQQQADLVHEANTFEAVAQDAEDCELLSVPKVYRDLSGGKVLTLERRGGWSLEDVLCSSQCDEAEQGTRDEGSVVGLDRRDLAGRLCTVWMQQALRSRYFPVEAGARNVSILPNNQLAFDGVFSSLPSASRKNLWEYLLAASTGDPDKACTHLIQIMGKNRQSVRESELRHQFRQVVPFRDGARSGPLEGTCLGDHLLVHWRLAESHGCQPPQYIVRFFRALLLVNDVAQRLAPGRDSLRDGLENVRVHLALGQMRDLMSLDQLNQGLERYAPLLLELPKRLDEALTLVAEGGARVNLQLRETAENRQQKNSTAAVSALLLVLAALALFAHHLALFQSETGWGGKIVVVVFVLVGVLLLGRLSGTR